MGIRQLLIILLLLLSSNAAAQTKFEASLDRQQLQFGQSITLTLEQTPAQGIQEPDISELKQQFNLLASRQGYLERDGQTVRQWVFRISPKDDQVKQVPAISLGQLTSSAIAIELLSQPPITHKADQSLFIRSHLDKQQVYLHEQNILRLSVYHANPLFGTAHLEHLATSQARVEQLGQPRHSEQLIDGQLFGVIEVNYAIYPLQTGELEIPSIEFSATTTDAQQLLQTGIIQPDTKVKLNSAPLLLKVLPPPTQFPSNAQWLPASSLSVEQIWSPADTSNLVSEQAIKRELQLRVNGLPASMLPQLLPQHQQHFALYNSPTLSQQQLSRNGIVSQQTQSQSLVTDQAGNYLIPTQRIPWWNTTNDQLEYIELPEQLIRVITPATTHILPDSDNLQFWQLLSFFLALGNLLFISLWQLGKRKPQRLLSGSNGRLLENLRRACKTNNPVLARNAIDALARQNSMSPSEAARQSPQFAKALDALNTVLYTEQTAQSWNGEQLWDAVSQMRNLTGEQSSDSLPPLYPP